MRIRTIHFIAPAAVLLCSAAAALAQTPLGSAFTYQGQLALNGAPPAPRR